MATRKKTEDMGPATVRELIHESGHPETPSGEFVNEVIACKRVSFRQPDGLLETEGLHLGGDIQLGALSGAKVTGIYVTQHGCVVELDHAGQARTILHTGDYAAELAP